MTKRARRAHEISRDLHIVSFIQGAMECYCDMPNCKCDESKIAIHDRVLAVRTKVGKAQMRETSWMDKGDFQKVRAEMDSEPRLEWEHPTWDFDHKSPETNYGRDGYYSALEKELAQVEARY